MEGCTGQESTQGGRRTWIGGVEGAACRETDPLNFPPAATECLQEGEEEK